MLRPRAAAGGDAAGTRHRRKRRREMPAVAARHLSIPTREADMTRRAFTLTELLCVVAVIAILVALLLPATRRVRVSAARSKCHNNLRQVALGAHLYADTHGYLPPATLPNPDLVPERRLSWYAAILPYVEQANLYSALDRAAPWDAPANAAAVKGWRPALFQCPSAPTTGSDAALTTSIGVAGLGADAAELPADDPRAGVFGYDRRIKLNEIRDGASNTALVMETTADLGPWLRGGPTTVRGVTPDAPPGGLHVGDRNYFWEDRPSGSNVALADGSVRFLRDPTAPAVWAALATVAGREELPGEW
jgi:prepilin-type N-terminal cleavage/methylation domain-containing protein